MFIFEVNAVRWPILRHVPYFSFGCTVCYPATRSQLTHSNLFSLSFSLAAQKILIYLPEILNKGWQQHSIGFLLQRLLHHQNSITVN